MRLGSHQKLHMIHPKVQRTILVFMEFKMFGPDSKNNFPTTMFRHTSVGQR